MCPHAGATSRVRLRPLLFWLACGLVAATTASADTTTIRDTKNTRANLFDIKSAMATQRGSLLIHRIRTFRTWRSSELRSTRRRPRIMCLYLWGSSPASLRDPDYQVCAKFTKRKLRGYVFDVRSSRKTKHTIEIRRLDLHSVTFRFRSSTIGELDSYGWQVVTGYTGRGCPRDPPFRYGCDDSAPTGTAAPHRVAPEPAPGT
jgi:hypothetical protein